MDRSARIKGKACYNFKNLWFKIGKSKKYTIVIYDNKQLKTSPLLLFLRNLVFL